jgi:hypothetical protein
VSAGGFALTGMFAIAAHADERDAHIREVQSYGQTLPEGSYGRRNRKAIADRETRVTARLRAVEQAYQAAFEREDLFSCSEPARECRVPEHEAGSAAVEANREIELG